MIKYAGIGARKTPGNVCLVMISIANYFAVRGMTLRSGGAIGADLAFRDGHAKAFANEWAQGKPICNLEIFRPHHSTPEAFDHAAKYHPAWEKCSADAQALHARNSLILLGRNLDDPVKFVVCWTPGGRTVGGTGQSLRVAEAYQIPVFNLFNDPAGIMLLTHAHRLLA